MADYGETKEAFTERLKYMERENLIEMCWKLYTEYLQRLHDETRHMIAEDSEATLHAILYNYHQLHDSSFSACDNQQLQDEVNQLKDKNAVLQEELNRLHRNAKRAGRKKSISNEIRANIIHDRNEGLSYRQLKDKYGYSLATFSGMFSKK